MTTLLSFAMHPGYVAWWVVLVAGMLTADVLRAPGWVWLALFGVFGLVEGIAGVRKKRGDMFSELMWTLRAAGPNTRGIAWSVAIYLPMRFFMIGVPWVPYWLPRLVLAVGVAFWLVPHFKNFGKGG